MGARNIITMSWEQATAELGVSPDASPDAMRQAYLAKVREFPPDKDPDTFERIRDAYDQLKDPHHRAKRVLHGINPSAPLTDLMIGLKPRRPFAGPKLWIDALREKMKEQRT
jgi:curved DNA-binding protein CbpA